MNQEQAEVYIDAKQAAQICNNVSVRTFYRYLDKASAELTVQTTTEIVNDHAVKLYRKADIVRLAKALNKDRTVLSYVPQNVRPSVVLDAENAVAPHIPEDRLAVTAKGLTTKTAVKIAVSTLLVQVLILSILLLIFGWFLWNQIHRESRQIASLKSFIAHRR